MGKSFYGGMDGRPFILKKIYQTIPEMIDRNRYKTELNYGEYALISNDNRNHPDNGKLFKRIYTTTETNEIKYSTYNKQTHCFEETSLTGVEMKYIGAIVGPQGSAVEFKILGENLDINSVKDEYKDLEMIQTISDLTPKTEAGTSTSAIKMNTYSFRDKNGNKSTVYLDMTIPYNVIEWTTTQLSSQKTVEISENEIYPFYQSYTLGIPKGQDGTSINSIKVIVPKINDKIYPFDKEIIFNNKGEILSECYEGLIDDANNNRQIWVAEIVNYKITDNGTKYLVYLGDYNIINDIMIDDEGTITIKYNHNDDSIWNKKLTWIKEVSISQDGTVSIESNNKTQLLSSNQQKLTWLKNVSLSQDGTFTKTNNQNVSVNQEQKLTWLENISLSQDGTFTKTNNQNESVNQTQKLKWVNGVSLSQDGTFIQSYNNGETTPQQNERLKWLENIQIADNGVVTKVYNHGDNDANTKLKWPINIQLNSEDGTVATTYNDGSVNTIQNPRMDWIKSATLNNDKLLQIDYVNADDISVNLKTPNQIELTKSGEFYATYNTGDRVLLGKIGELNPISTTAIAEGEKEPANLMAGGLLFITQDAITEG